MARKPTKPPAPPKLTRKQSRAYDDAIKDTEQEIALRMGDPEAIMAAARKKATDIINRTAAQQPTPARQKIAEFAKRGLRYK